MYTRRLFHSLSIREQNANIQPNTAIAILTSTMLLPFSYEQTNDS